MRFNRYQTRLVKLPTCSQLTVQMTNLKPQVEQKDNMSLADNMADLTISVTMKQCVWTKNYI